MNALPKEAQPQRESHKTVATSAQRNNRLPTPGHPARGLGPPGIQESAEEGLAPDGEDPESAAEDAELPPGLIELLPHSLFRGGVTAEYIYTGESFSLARGGFNGRQATNYRGNFDLALTIDTEKMGAWEGGRFFIYGNNTHGRPLSAQHVGDWQFFSNIDSTIGAYDDGSLLRPYFTAVGEYWYEHHFDEGRLRAKIGKQDANADFAFADLGGDFINASFQLPPTIPLPTWPSQVLGLSTFWKVSENGTFAVGVYDGTAPNGSQGVRFGFDSLGHNGAISLYQYTLTTQTGPQRQHPGTVRFGAWHHWGSDDWTEITLDPNPRAFRDNFGFWFSVDQMLWKESYGDDDVQGLSVFTQASWAPEDRNPLVASAIGGVVYVGLLAGRDADLTGVGLATAFFGGPYRAVTTDATGIPVQSFETSVEVFYKIRVSPHCSIQPEVQYIVNPSGMFDDALLAGVRFEAVL